MEPLVDIEGLDLPGLADLRRAEEGGVALPHLVEYLASVDVTALTDGGAVLEMVAAWERVTAATTALQQVAVAELARRPEPASAGVDTRTWVGDELAARLIDARWVWERRTRTAEEMPTRFPETWHLFSRGLVAETKVRIVVEGCGLLDDDAAQHVDRLVGPRAPRLTPSRLREAVRRAALRVDPATAAERRERATAERRVQFTAVDNGMCELYAVLPAHSAVALERALDAAARSARAAGDERTLEQLRADFLTERVTTSVEVQVVVPASVLMGLSDDPAELSGYGSVDADLARTLASDATWRRLLTDPDDGSLVSLGAGTYRPGAVLARHVAARDRTCRFPGCDRPAAVCDVDHTIPFPHGPTSPHNTGLLCRRHHRFKHDTNGSNGDPPRLRQPAPGHFVWTMPTGQVHIVRPSPQLDPGDPLVETGAELDDGWSPAERALIRRLSA